MSGLMWFLIGAITALTVWEIVATIGGRIRHRRIVRRWRTPQLLLALALLMPLAGGGCASNAADPQYQQFQAQVAFWTGEVARLRAAIETLPPGKSRDDLVKQLTQAQYWLSFFDALVNPPRPTTQPVKAA